MRCDPKIFVSLGVLSLALQWTVCHAFANPFKSDSSDFSPPPDASGKSWLPDSVRSLLGLDPVQPDGGRNSTLRLEEESYLQRLKRAVSNGFTALHSALMIWVWDPVQNLFYPVPYTEVGGKLDEIKSKIAAGKNPEDFFSFWVWNPIKRLYINIPSRRVSESADDIARSKPAEYIENFYERWAPIGQFLKAGDAMYNFLPGFPSSTTQRILFAQKMEFSLIGFLVGLVVKLIYDYVKELIDESEDMEVFLDTVK